MAMRGDGVVGCIGVCNMKDMRLFNDRRGGKKPSVVPISAVHMPPIRMKGGMSVDELRKLNEELREKRNGKPLIRRGDDITCKKMRKRRDRAQMYFKAKSNAYKAGNDKESDENEEENSEPQTQNLYVIFRMLFVILGLGILICLAIMLISLIPDDTANKSISKTDEALKSVNQWKEKQS